MNKHLAKDLERYADMLAEGELISPDDLNCSAIMRLAAEALAQPEQEPVAYVIEAKSLGAVALKLAKELPIGTQLYTTPSQRKQLTDDEAFELIEQDYQMEEYAQAALQLIRRTEAAHGIK